MENGRDVVGSIPFLLIPLGLFFVAFRGVPLNVIQQNWLSVCNS